MLLLAACSSKELDDSGSGGGPASVSRYWEPPTYACSLSRPMSVTGLVDPGSLYGPTPIDLGSAWTEFQSVSERVGCPAALTNGDTTLLYGECTGEDITWSGTWAHSETAGVFGDDMDFEAWDDWIYPHIYARGTAELVLADAWYTYARRFDWSTDDGNGDWTVDADDYFEYQSELFSGRFDVETDTLSGDYCFVIDETASDDCADEPEGGWVVIGDHTLVVAFDPTGTCDGCGRVTLDGETIGEVCGDEAGIYVPR